MFENLLNSPVQQFILDHEGDDERDIILKYNDIYGIPVSVIANQIAGRKKAKRKLPLYYNTPCIIYPAGINLEQCSSEKTALYKVSILTSTSLKHHAVCADLTGGFGIDSFYLSQLFKTVHYIEPNQQLIEIARHNHTSLGCKNIEYHNSTAEDFLKVSSLDFDLIYADPSRRAPGHRKVFKLASCEPDVTRFADHILTRSKMFMLKASPLLDIRQGIRGLTNVSAIYIVSVANECKEVLLLCSREPCEEPVIGAINILKEKTESFTFSSSFEKTCAVQYADPMRYLYEPNASILKAGAFKSVAHQYGLFKIHPNTHLYTADTHETSFPGRIFAVEVVKPEIKMLRKFFPDGKANVIARNYPATTEELKKKMNISDGGEKFLIAFRSFSEKYTVVAERI